MCDRNSTHMIKIVINIKHLKKLQSVYGSKEHKIIKLFTFMQFFCVQTSVLIFLQVKQVPESGFRYLVFKL